jgi:hypothetical protein
VDPSANCPPCIDGYGKLEVVTGNDKVYAWHDDGKEVLDGDHQGITGVLSAQGKDFVAPPRWPISTILLVLKLLRRVHVAAGVLLPR